MNNKNIIENISFFLDEETINQENNINIDELLNNIDKESIPNLYCEEFLPNVVYYNMNYTVKELLLICDYYNIAKEVKTKKYNKEELCNFLVDFELNPENNNIVLKRKNMWFYINEIKNDKFMKKYVIW